MLPRGSSDGENARPIGRKEGLPEAGRRREEVMERGVESRGFVGSAEVVLCGARGG